MILSRKKEFVGFSERARILSGYIGRETPTDLWDTAKQIHCSPDDVMDAVCLAVVAGIKVQGGCETIPEGPMEDSKGLLMQMIVPQKGSYPIT